MIAEKLRWGKTYERSQKIAGGSTAIGKIANATAVSKIVTANATAVSKIATANAVAVSKIVDANATAVSKIVDAVSKIAIANAVAVSKIATRSYRRKVSLMWVGRYQYARRHVH